MGNIGVLVKQRFQINVRIILAIAIATVLLAISHSSIAGAQSTANTLKVSPVRTDIEIKPGESKIVQTTVTNLTKDAVNVKASINDFVSGDEAGTPALILDEGKYATSHSLKRFITPVSNVTIPGGQAKTINVIITVPANAQAGGYFGAVRFAPSSPDDGGQVNLSASVASLILLTVPGDVIEKLDLTSFTIQQNGKVNTNFGSPENLAASFRFENKGNLQNGPFGKITVKQGEKVVYQTDFNNKDPRDVILPGGARVWDVPLEDIGSFGNYTVLATFTYGKKNETIEVVKSFWIIPQFVIIMAIVALVVLIGLIVGLIFFIRARTRRRRIPRGIGYRR